MSFISVEQLAGFSGSDLYSITEGQLDTMSRTDAGCDAIARACNDIVFKVRDCIYAEIDQVSEALTSVQIGSMNGQSFLGDSDDINFLCGQVTKCWGYKLPKLKITEVIDNEVSFGRGLRERMDGAVDLSMRLIDILVPTYFMHGSDSDEANDIRDAISVLVTNGICAKLQDRSRSRDGKAKQSLELLERNLDRLGLPHLAQ